MESAIKRRHDRSIFVVIAAYFLPVIFLTILSGIEISSSPSIVVFGLGLLAASAGSILLIVLFKSTPERIIERVEVPVIQKEEVKETLEETEKEKLLELEVERLKAEWFQKKQEHDRLLERYEKVERELVHYQTQTEEHLRKKEVLLSEYTKTVEELYKKMEEKQNEIVKLEGSVSDLTYDLDTLIKLSETKEKEAPAPRIEVVSLIRTEKDAEQLLKRCMNTLQKFTSSHFSSIHEHNALDQRRLYDSFRSEQAAIVFLYSLKEGAMAFVSDASRIHLGWSADELAHDFFDLIAEGAAEWRESISSLAFRGEANIHLLMRSQGGQDLLMQCRIALIPTGVFKHQAVGILYR